MKARELLVLFLLFLSDECVGGAAKTYYDILGVNKRASEQEIKKSYRELAKKYHPDKNKDDQNAQAKFIEVSNAYETLSDLARRREYDLSLSDSQAGPRGASRTFDRRNPHFTHFSSNPRQDPRTRKTYHFSSSNGDFHYTSSSDGLAEALGWMTTILSVGIFLMPFICLCCSALPLYGLYLLCCGRSKKSQQTTTSPSEAATGTSQTLPLLTKSALELEGRVLIVALSSEGYELVRKELKPIFLHDPVYFCHCTTDPKTARSTSRKSSSSPKLAQFVALQKHGKRYDLYPPLGGQKDSDEEGEEGSDADSDSPSAVRWIERILEGQGRWRDVDQMPKRFRDQLPFLG
jgi:hypothetical protein